MDSQQPFGKKPRIKWTYIETIFCITTALIVFVPLLLTRDWGLPSFRETGPIGDTIGGTTAPFIGLLGAWLVYKALKAQIDANSLIIQQFEHQKKSEQANKIVSTLTDQINILREDIKDYKFNWIDANYSSHWSEGASAIQDVLDSYPIYHVEELSIVKNHEIGIVQIQHFLESMEYIVVTADKPELEEMDRHYLKKLVLEIFTTKFLLQIHGNIHKKISSQPPCQTCGKKHGIGDEIFTIADVIGDRF